MKKHSIPTIKTTKAATTTIEETKGAEISEATTIIKVKNGKDHQTDLTGIAASVVSMDTRKTNAEKRIVIKIIVSITIAAATITTTAPTRITTTKRITGNSNKMTKTSK